MNQQEHAHEARELTGRAQQEQTSGGNDRIAAEFLWGAFAHCLIAVALNERLHHDSHGAFREIARYMDAAEGGNQWRSRFGSADMLHRHFYHGHLTSRLLQTYSEDTAHGTAELLRML